MVQCRITVQYAIPKGYHDGNGMVIYEGHTNNNNIFIGTLAEYQEANSKNLIPDGMLVHITDDNNQDDEDFYIPSLTTSILGVGKLGHMTLG